ncbi:hypothetical protein [Palleronia sp.]|uniref:hypothetical protein n=1 Tax=Palleronia sp. TaxID=1940284 RepID=UPI0035C7FCC2
MSFTVLTALLGFAFVATVTPGPNNLMLRSLLSVAIVAGAFAVVCFPAISVWAWIGTVVRQHLSNTTRLRVFNFTKAALLVASLYPVLGLDA